MKKSVVKQNTIPKEILQLINAVINNTAKRAFNVGKEKPKGKIDNYYQHLENRLTAFPQLLLNIEEYEEDIKDLEIEGQAPRKSKDICGMPGQGIRLTDEEKFEARILAVKHRKQIDEEEVAEITEALKLIKDDEFYLSIEYKYFDDKSDEEAAELLDSEKTKVWRKRGKLMKKMMAKLYGANAFK